jgi:hypothetical protein
MLVKLTKNHEKFYKITEIRLINLFLEKKEYK